MIDKKSIVKMAKHAFRAGQGRPDIRLIHPQREWVIGLCIFMFVVTASVLVTGDIFTMNQNTDLIEGDAGKRIPKYQKAAVEESIDLYRSRSDEYEKLKSNKVPIFVDIFSGVENAIPEEETLVEVEGFMLEVE
ncbi:MAG: hypothetical protein ACI92I_000951 [Acidimicrobiales bacterium]|jgi:hypothetical protein